MFPMASRPQQQSVQPDQLGAQRGGQSAPKGVVAGPGDGGERCGSLWGLFCFQLALQTQSRSHTQRFAAVLVTQTEKEKIPKDDRIIKTC